ncbi:MAG: DNA repair protein RecN [Dehalococcoidia bacterium]|nr:DNA repair protein RecN [Dehalococcoidia bacterium]
MLIGLRIVSFGIVEELIFEPCTGLNVITGETGAGKSIAIDAISTLFEGKLDETNIRFGAEFSRIEATFQLSSGPQYKNLISMLETYGIVLDESLELIVNCEYRRHGRTVSRLNGINVTRAFMGKVGALLVDIHAQSQHLSLFERSQHLNYLDDYAHLSVERNAFTKQTEYLHELTKELSDLRNLQSSRLQQEGYLRFQLDEIKHAQLKIGEEEELEQQCRILSSCEKIKALTYDTYQALNGEDESVALSRIRSAKRSLNSLVSLDQSLKTHLETLDSAYNNIEDVARELISYHEGLEFDPHSLEKAEGRLQTIRLLKKKYGASIAQILEMVANIETELEKCLTCHDEITRLENAIGNLKVELGKQAQDLSQKRLAAASLIEKAVESELGDLNMRHVRLKVQFCIKESPEGIPIDNKVVAFTSRGIDEVEFMVSTNLGEPFMPLVKIASTGEVSRFTLALKVVLAEADCVPILIFDEIDIGIGGRSGDMIGKKLWYLSGTHQIICVTHLPQIATYAKCHFIVEKSLNNERVCSKITLLDTQSRINELTAMLGGAEAEKTSRLNAIELSKQASAWIASQK